MKRSGLADIALVVVPVATLGLLAGYGGSSGSSSSDETAKFRASYGSVGDQFKEISRAIGTGIE